MIYWFSGTGNSRWVAESLGSELHDTLLPMTENTHFVLPDMQEACIGFIFPVYGWGLPLAVANFIERMPHNTNPAHNYIYSVLTCGDDIGRTDRLLRKALKKKGYELHAVFSVQMRNTYVCLPFFNTDDLDVETEKQAKATIRLHEIAQVVAQKQQSTPADIHPGGMPGFKSYILRPLFNRLLTSDHRFKVNHNLCTHCKRCINCCPLHNITPSADGTPLWGGHCTHCLACYHSCPHHAINYGWFTAHKGRVRVIVRPNNKP